MKRYFGSPKGIGGQKIAVMTAALAVAGGSLIAIPSANAVHRVSDNYWGPQYGAVTEVSTEYNSEGSSWIGGVATRGYTNGTSYDRGYTWCIQWAYSANGEELRTPEGTSKLSGESARMANIIIDKYADDPANHPEIALAIHEIFDDNPEDGGVDGRPDGNAWEYEKQHNTDSTFRAILSTSQDWVEDAEQYAGPYTIEPDLSFEDEEVSPGDVGEIVNLEVLSGDTSLGDGTDTVGNEIEATVELEGNLQFTSGNEKVQTFTPGETPEVEVTGAGPINATVTTNEAVPADTVTRINFDGWQDRITHNAPLSISGETPIYNSVWEPSIETQTSQQRVEPGSPLYDTLEVEGVPEGEDVTISSTLYYAGDQEPERQSDIPEHAVPVETVETVINGPGTYQTPEVVVEDYGWHVWVETIEGTDEMKPWTSDYGIRQEVTIVPWEPKVTTEVSSQRAMAGDEIYDTLIIEDNMDGQELTVQSTLYGPFDHREEQGTELPEDAPIHTTMETVIVGNGEFQTDPVVLEESGYYFWTEEIAETDVTAAWGDDEDESPTWQVQETTIVPWTIESSSEISDRSADLGSSVFDTVWFDGFPWDHAVDRGESFLMAPPANQPDSSGQYTLPITEDGSLLDNTDTQEATLTMYGPLEAMPEQSEDIPEDAPVHDTVTVPAVNGEIVSAPFKEYNEAGYYTIVTEFEGSERVEPYVSDFGIPSESTYVASPDEPELPPVPEEPAETVTPDNPPEDVKTPDQVQINSGNPDEGSMNYWTIGAGAIILAAGLGGYLLYRRKRSA